MSKTELEEMGEDVSDMATTTSQLQAKLLALTGGKVDIMLDETTFKNSTQILREMADAWGSMNDIQRASALELMGGKRQANVLSALINNFDTVEKAIETSANSSGSALRENERYLDSIQGKIDQFNNATQALWSNFLDADVVKDVVAFGTELVKIIDKIGPLNVALVGLFTFIEAKYHLLGDIFKPAEEGLDSIRKKVAKAEKDLAKATAADLRNPNRKTAQNRRDAEERVKIAQTQEVNALKTRREDLLGKQTAAQQLADMPDASEEVKKDLETINAQLAQTNRELAEAEAKLAKIDKDYKPSDLTDSVRDAADAFDPDKQKKSITGKKSARTKRINKLQAEGKTFDEIQSDPKVKQYTKDIEDAEQALNAYTVAENAKANAEAAGAGATMAGAAATRDSVNADVLAKSATDGRTASTWAAIWAEMTRVGATGASVAATIKQVIATKLANSALVQQGLAIMRVTVAEGANIPVTTMLTAGFVGLAASIWTAIKAMWTLMTTTPIGWILLAAAAIAAVVGVIDLCTKSAKELREELSNLKQEISDNKSEIESLNSELETTQERMAELLAKDSLTFTEKEELDNLQKQNDELERQIALLEAKNQRLQDDAQDAVDDLTDKELASAKRDIDGDGEEDDEFDRSLERRMDRYDSQSEKLEELEKKLAKAVADGKDDKAARLQWRIGWLKRRMGNTEDKVDDELDEYLEYADDIDYETADKKTKSRLDYIYNRAGKWNIKQGGDQVQTTEIKRVFNKSTMKDTKDEIDELVEKLAKDPGNQTIIDKISEKCKVAESDLKTMGLSVQDATDYFTMLGTNASFDTLEGKTKEMTAATQEMKTLLSDTNSEDFKSLFDDDGNVDKVAIAKKFKGTSEATREEIARLVQEIKDEKIKADAALKQFELFSIESVLKITISEVQTNFKDVFVDLEEADGLIDTFEELGEAIGSTADALKAFDKAEAEMAKSGRVSIQTALALMEYTDDYGSVLQVVDGRLQLVDNAEEILIQTRIDAIKKSAEASLQEAELAYARAQEATANYKTALETDMSASVVATAWEKVLAAAAGLWAGIKSLLTDESWDDAYNNAYNDTLSKITGYETTYDDAGLQALIDDEKRLKDAVDAAADRVELISQITPETIEDIYESDDVDSIEDVVKSRWDKLLAKYERELALITNERDLIQAEIDKAEARGGKASAKYYEDLKRNSEEEKQLLIEKKTALENYLAENKNSIDPDTWTEYNNEINETAVAIKECEQNTIEYGEAIREIDLHYFEQAKEEISRLGEELEFVNSLLEDEDVADENGNWSSAAITRMGIYTQQMEKAAVEAAMYQDEIDELNKAYANGERSEEQYQEELADLVSGQQDAIQSYEDAKDGIIELNEARIDAIKEGIEKEIEAYEDLIDAKKEELDAERDLYDFRKNIKNQTKDIAALERRIASLSGSTAASDIAERRKLEAQLAEAKEGLNDTYYDHSRDAQSAALDEESEAYARSKEKYIEQLEKQLDETELLIQNSIMDVLLNADVVYNELNTLADKYGITLSDELTQPWKDASAQAIAWKDELKNSMTSGDYAALIGEDGAITAFSNGVALKLEGSWSKAKTAAQNYAGYLTGEELKKKFSNTLSGFGNQIQTIIDKWNGVKKAADDAYSAQTRTSNVGGNPNLGGNNDGGGGIDGGGGYNANVAALQEILNGVWNAGLKVDGKLGTATTNAIKNAQMAINKHYKSTMVYPDGAYGPETRDAMLRYFDDAIRTMGNNAPSSYIGQGIKRYQEYKKKLPVSLYAKGTMGTSKSGFAITDESWIGEEITLAAGKNGQLQYLKKGSAVMPADISANLVEWGKLNPNAMSIGGVPNLNMISNAINKPEFNMSFDSLVHVDHCDEGTLKDLEKMIDTKINQFGKQMNYAIKKIGGR